MKFFNPLFLVLFCSFLLPLRAEIHEISSLSEVHHYLNPNTVVFCELDELILQSPLIASKPAFFSVLKHELLAEGYSSEQASHKLYSIYYEVFSKSSFEVSSNEVFSFLEALAAKRISCIPLTYRGPRLAYQTKDHLKQLNLDFFVDKPFLKNHVFEPHLAHFYEGCLFVHPVCSKSTYLLKLLESFKAAHKQIVCLDTQLLSLVEMEELLNEKGISFIGLYFKGKEESLNSKEIQIGKLQVKYSNKILPDPMGRLLAEKKNQEHEF